MPRSKSIASSPRAFTLVEIMIATTVSLMVTVGMVSTYTMASRFLAQGMTESRMIYRASIAIEKMTRNLNGAFRNDATISSRRFVISTDRRTITFSIPTSTGGAACYRYRFDATGKKLYYEMQNAGAFANVGVGPFLKEISNFAVDNQEGILSLVLTMNVDLARNGNKYYTIVGRALPRNL